MAFDEIAQVSKKATIKQIKVKGVTKEVNNKVLTLSTENNPYYYAIDGTFLGIGNDKTKTTEVRLAKPVETANGKNYFYPSDIKGRKTDNWVVINNNYDNFINRVNWAYGEGGGDAADYYAHAINNLAKIEGENKMYIHMNQGHSTTPEAQKKKYFIDFSEGNPNYKRFRKYVNGEVFVTEKDKGLKEYYEERFKAVTKATIGVLVGLTDDPTNGSTNWAGGKENISYTLEYNKGNQVIVVKSEGRYGFTSYNTFYQLGFKKTQPDIKYTLITYYEFQKMSTEIINVSK